MLAIIFDPTIALMTAPELQENLQKMLLQRIAQQDEQAFRSLYHIYNARLRKFAFALVKSRENAEEIVEDVFIKLWKQRQNLEAINNIGVYLYTATKNTALNYLSKQAIANILEPFDNIDIKLCPEDHQSPDELMITAEMHLSVKHAIESLPPRCKMIFKLVREDGLKYRDVSDILGISVNTIDAQMAIAVKRIWEAVSKRFELPRPAPATNKK